MAPSAPTRSLVDRVFVNPDTGDVAVVQVPNLLLIVFLMATAVRVGFDPRGAWGTLLSVVGLLGLTWWAGLEVVRGDSLFRRILGGAVLVGLVATRLLR
jgi:hypothetical protein